MSFQNIEIQGGIRKSNYRKAKAVWGECTNEVIQTSMVEKSQMNLHDVSCIKLLI